MGEWKSGRVEAVEECVGGIKGLHTCGRDKGVTI